MTNRLAEIVLIVGIVATIVIALMPPPAKAQEQPCKSLSDVEAEIEAVDGIIAGAAYYAGAHTDSLIVVDVSGTILLYGFKDGCYVGAMAVEAALPRTAA